MFHDLKKRPRNKAGLRVVGKHPRIYVFFFTVNVWFGKGNSSKKLNADFGIFGYPFIKFSQGVCVLTKIPGASQMSNETSLGCLGDRDYILILSVLRGSFAQVIRSHEIRIPSLTVIFHRNVFQTTQLWANYSDQTANWSPQNGHCSGVMLNFGHVEMQPNQEYVIKLN